MLWRSHVSRQQINVSLVCPFYDAATDVAGKPKFTRLSELPRYSDRGYESQRELSSSRQPRWVRGRIRKFDPGHLTSSIPSNDAPLHVS